MSDTIPIQLIPSVTCMIQTGEGIIEQHRRADNEERGKGMMLVMFLIADMLALAMMLIEDCCLYKHPHPCRGIRSNSNQNAS